MRMAFHRSSLLVKGFPRGLSAFTLVEMLVVIAIIGVLAGLLIPALARTGQDAKALQCSNQMRQLTLAWFLYADENEGWLAPNRLNSVKSWVGGIMGVNAENGDSTNIQKLLDPAYSKLGPYVKTAATFRCPLDRSKIFYGGVSSPRVRSYAMNAAVGFPLGPESLPFSPGWRSYQRFSNIIKPVPSQLWVLTEEHPDSIDDCVFTVDCESRGTQERFISVPANYHRGAANFSFADGHVELHRWQDARTLLPNKYCGCLASYAHNGYYTMVPNSPDVTWVQERSSSNH